ncbi:MAG TPA: PilN domain-containing protein [Rhodanobacteraceae bacterium]|nr:PilN domain-containing protein [Rhodanobacteraceae bacterium]
MAKINLLPWRAERRERRKREFFAQLIIAAVAALVLVVLWGFWSGLRIDRQNDRNAYLQTQIKQLDAKIVEIKNLQKVRDHLLARKRIVEQLQSSRSQMVHLFDQIVKTIPAGARLTSLKQQADKLTLDGVAQSNATVADYMRNIEASPWMGPATLIRTENVHTSSNTPYEFELVVALGTPKADANGEVPAAAGSSGGAALPLPAASSAGAATASSVARPQAVPVAKPAPASAPTKAAPSVARTPAASAAKGARP